MALGFFGYVAEEDGCVIINADLVRKVTYKAGILEIWFSETDKIRFEGKAGIALLDRFTDISKDFNGKKIVMDWPIPRKSS
jgi:hypothetical protein